MKCYSHLFLRLLFLKKSITIIFIQNLRKQESILKLLWNEYRNQCISKGTIPCGYTKFCKGYSNYVQLSNVTNHLTHKPGSTIEVDWSGPTMSILTPDGERIKVYLFCCDLTL